jgi:glutamine synthetase
MASHIHVSLRDSSGHNVFAVSEEELVAGGRKGAFHQQLRFISQEAEWFLAGVVEGLADGELHHLYSVLIF